MSDLEKQVAVLENCYQNLQSVVIDEKKRLNGNLEKIDKRLECMQGDLQQVQTAALSKPSWGVTIALTALVGAVCTLGTWALTRR